MKQPIAVRVEPDLLAAVRACARAENRSVTNFIETVLKAHVAKYEMPVRDDQQTKPRATASATRRSAR